MDVFAEDENACNNAWADTCNLGFIYRCGNCNLIVQHNKQYHLKELLNSCYLNGHTPRFHTELKVRTIFTTNWKKITTVIGQMYGQYFNLIFSDQSVVWLVKIQAKNVLHYWFSWYLHCILNRPFLNCLFPLCHIESLPKTMHSYKNVFPLQVYFHQNQNSLWYETSRARAGYEAEVTQKWPIVLHLYTLYRQNTQTERP